MGRKFLVTAALPYSNGKLHVGHIAGAYLPADIYVRYLKANGDDVLFICGSDDNGAAIELRALSEGTTPAEIVAKYNASQAESFKGLGIDFNVYGGTHTPGFVDTHNDLSQKFFLAIHEKGYFTKRTTTQLFDTQANRFLPDRYITGTCYHCNYDKASGDQCESCGKTIEPLKLKNPKSVITGTEPIPKETTHWHLRLADFEKPLAEWLESNTDWRTTVLNFSLGQIKSGLPERAMTRDLQWGIPVPLDDPDAQGKVLFVWFDAPIGYVSFTSQYLQNSGGAAADYEQWWKNPDCKIVHFIGEDNIIFHALIWPAMLMAEGEYQLPHQVVANSFLNIKFPGKEEEKISKSRGTAIWIEDYLNNYDPDPLRYYLTAIAPEAARTAYDPQELITRNDTELLATLGNLVNRVITFTHKYFEGKVPEAGEYDEIDQKMLRDCATQVKATAEQIEGYHFKQALFEMMTLARAGNQYLDVKKPWAQRKTDLAACGRSLNVCLQTIRTLTVIMQPFLPHSARSCLKMLNLDESALAWNRATELLPDLHPLGEAVVLFKKLAEVETPAS